MATICGDCREATRRRADSMNSSKLPPDTAVIGGSGFDQLAGFVCERRVQVATPYGEPSAAPVLGHLRGRAFAFLPRHGAGHAVAPHRVNYRANIWALREIGVRRIIALAAVGGISAAFPPGAVVIPDQIIDYTWGRRHTFHDAPDENLRHIDFSRPYNETLRREIIAAAKRGGVDVVIGAVYAATQGPRLETAAEIDRLERDGADVVGMTGMPEAALARELDLDYAALALVVNPAAGRTRTRSSGEIDMESIKKYLAVAAEGVVEILANL